MQNNTTDSLHNRTYFNWLCGHNIALFVEFVNYSHLALSYVMLTEKKLNQSKNTASEDVLKLPWKTGEVNPRGVQYVSYLISITSGLNSVSLATVDKVFATVCKEMLLFLGGSVLVYGRGSVALAGVDV